MLTVTNNLPTHLVVPGGAGEGAALQVPPRGRVQVERVTAAIKDAERRGLLSIGYPDGMNGAKGGRRKDAAKATE